MKIAFCLYGGVGQTSTRSKNFDSEYIDPEICYNQYRHFGLLTEDCDVYLHTWDSPYNQKVVDLYQPKKHLIETTPKLSVTDRYYGTHCRFYSQKKVIDLISEDYDMVFLTRFDLAWHVPLDISSYDPDYFYLQHSNWLDKNMGKEKVDNWNRYHACDWWFMSNLETMKKFVENYLYINTHLQSIQFTPSEWLKNGNQHLKSPQHYVARRFLDKVNIPLRYILNRDEDHTLIRNVLIGEDPQTKKNIWVKRDGIYHLNYTVVNKVYRRL